jgi:hypothetical protein
LDWAAIVRRCPALTELRAGLADARPTGSDTGFAPAALLALLEAAPQLHVHGAHVLLRVPPGGLPAAKEAFHAALAGGGPPRVSASIAELEALMAHPHATVATLRVRLPGFLFGAAGAMQLARLLESPAGACVRALDVSRTLRSRAQADTLAFAVAGCPNLQARTRVASHQMLRVFACSRVRPPRSALHCTHCPVSSARAQFVRVGVPEEENQLMCAALSALRDVNSAGREPLTLTFELDEDEDDEPFLIADQALSLHSDGGLLHNVHAHPPGAHAGGEYDSDAGF